MTAQPHVVIAGLGPATEEYVTAAVTAAIARIPHRYVRTARHPSASVVTGAVSFDDVYEAADTFEDVYAEIADRLTAAAREHGEVLYCVPGSPLVLERTTQHLRADGRIRTTVLPSLSFLDLAYDRLGIDPVEAKVRLIDGHSFVTDAAGETGPLLVAHCHANWVLSEIKLAVETAEGDEPVVILQRLGCPDEAITHTTWAELDRTVEADHLTSIFIPRLAAPVGAELMRFHQIVRRLRAECPWDREQTHASLARYAVEETYELVEAIGRLRDDDGTSDEELIGELGDVLLQVVLHSAIAEEDGRFTLADVAQTVSDKMIRRHPHVFGDVDAADAEEVAANWQVIKAAERGEESAVAAGVFDHVSGSLPALLYAAELHSAARKSGFVWPSIEHTMAKVREELGEVEAELASGDHAALTAELGDVFMASITLCKDLGVEPEVAVRQSAAKFRRRFEALQEHIAAHGLSGDEVTPERLIEGWNAVKAAERGEAT